MDASLFCVCGFTVWETHRFMDGWFLCDVLPDL